MERGIEGGSVVRKEFIVLIMPLLFSYGTLQFSNVQKDTFGRLLLGTKESLEGYKEGTIKITDKAVIKSSGTNIHPVLRKTNQSSGIISGTLFEITDQELLKADEYEVDDYKRVEEVFQSGKKGWLYIGRN